MSDHQFEKNVRQQLEELRFHPGDAVWTGVEKRIASRRRKRRGIIWIPVLLLLITSGYWMSQYNSTTDSKQTTTTINKTSVDKQPSASMASGEPELSAASSPSPVTSKPKQNIHATVPEADIPGRQQSVKNSQPVIKKINPTDRSTPRLTNYQKKLLASNPPHNKTRADANTFGHDTRAIITTEQKNKTTPAVLEKAPDKISTETESNNAPVTESKSLMDSIAGVTAKPTNNMETDSVATVAAFTPVPAATTGKDSTVLAAIPPIEKRKSKWQLGITVQGGFSNVTEGGFFDVTQKSMVQDVAANSYSSPLPANAVLPAASDIRPAASFTAGLFIKKPVFKRIDLSAGLNYVFMQTSIQVGYWSQSNQMVLNARGAMEVNAYYRAGTQQKYFNQYHLLEVPVQAAFRLNKRRQFPVTLTTGISVATLVKSNALHFDGASRVYYQDNSLFNKTQFGFSGGLSIGLLQRTAHPVAIGPFFHYRASNLMKHTVSGKRHLQAFGLDLKVLLKK